MSRGISKDTEYKNFLLAKYDNGAISIYQGEEYSVDLTAADFNRLAMQAPLVKRMVEYVKQDYVGYHIDYPRACLRDKLLAEIAELEQE